MGSGKHNLEKPGTYLKLRNFQAQIGREKCSLTWVVGLYIKESEGQREKLVERCNSKHQVPVRIFYKEEYVGEIRCK